MSLNAYSTGKTAQQIVEECERVARYPGLNKKANGNDPGAGELRQAIAYGWLLDILKETYTLFDWPGTQKATTLQLIARSQSLPSDFWRLQYENGLIILLDNERVPLENCTREKFFTTMVDNANTARPLRFYIDRTKAGSLFVDPIPDRTYLAELHYYALPADLTNISDVPDFPYDAYLFWALLERYFIDQDDTRLAVAIQNKTKLLMDIRGISFDTREQDSSSTLDNRFFSGMPWEYE